MANLQNLQRTLEELQEQESSILEKEHTCLQDVVKYWQTVKRIQLLFVAAAKQHVKYIGLQRVPQVASSEAQAKDAIHMLLLAEAMQHSPYGRLPWTVEDFNPMLYKTPPEGLKRGGRNVRVQFCGDPETEGTYTYWGHYYTYDAISATWHEARGGMDTVGLWYQEGGSRVYHTRWEDEGRKVCGGAGAITWTFPTRDEVDTVAPPLQTPPRHESTRLDDTPTPPELTRYSPDEPEHHRPPAKRPARRTPGNARKGTKRIRGPGPSPIAPRDVGAVHHTIHRQGRGNPLQRLLDDAADPVALCFEGRTPQLKTIRHRITHGNYRVGRISTTWRWVGVNGEDKSKMLVTFDTDSDRGRFMQEFRTGASGVRLFHVNLFGL
ncbi:E2 [Gull papillomavirus 1]|uniref:Protein E8^E2C n=1 Tax=Gull papillomavirus 1 TaxID=2562547 RepID=A0AAE5YMN4_9PAPI|nr:E2 [Gull papillomavirus 1]